LPLDLKAMNRFACILHHRVALDVDTAEFLIHLHVDDMDAEAGTCAGDVHFRMPRNGAQRQGGLAGDLGNRKRGKFADIGTRRSAIAVFKHHAFLRTPQISAARRHSSVIALRVESMITMPLE